MKPGYWSEFMQLFLDLFKSHWFQWRLGLHIYLQNLLGKNYKAWVTWTYYNLGDTPLKVYCPGHCQVSCTIQSASVGFSWSCTGHIFIPGLSNLRLKTPKCKNLLFLSKIEKKNKLWYFSRTEDPSFCCHQNVQMICHSNDLSFK